VEFARLSLPEDGATQNGDFGMGAQAALRADGDAFLTGAIQDGADCRIALLFVGELRFGNVALFMRQCFTE
jgi:hypothetical protein